MNILITIAGAVSRVLDGMGIMFTVPLMALCAGVSAWWGIDPHTWQGWSIIALVTVACTAALQFGFVDWTRFSNSQIGKYWVTLGAGIIANGFQFVSPDWLMWYFLAIVIAGLAHPVLALVAEWRDFHYTRYAEAISGACVIGPWSFA